MRRRTCSAASAASASPCGAASRTCTTGDTSSAWPPHTHRPARGTPGQRPRGRAGAQPRTRCGDTASPCCPARTSACARTQRRRHVLRRMPQGHRQSPTAGARARPGAPWHQAHASASCAAPRSRACTAPAQRLHQQADWSCAPDVPSQRSRGGAASARRGTSGCRARPVCRRAAGARAARCARWLPGGAPRRGRAARAARPARRSPAAAAATR